ncbi:MAG: HNH endonuclease [Candidatus Marinimicrobia bacterium]|nr:HNH endonuclease [Candidatus Neomarinimicrobiota bacterium]
MSDWISINKDDKHIARERAKAKALRNSQWWQNKLNEGICYYCGKQFPRDELTMDHIVSVARGGTSTKGNIVPCCKQCNNDKKYLTPVEMLMKKVSSVQKKKTK